MRERKEKHNPIYKELLTEIRQNPKDGNDPVVKKEETMGCNIVRDEDLLNQFESYNKEKNNWIGSREYWECIFEEETNRDTELHKKFSALHKELVDKVIMFCKENNIEMADCLDLRIDGISDSVEDGYWGCGTDSSMSLKKFHWEETDSAIKFDVRDEEDFLYEI